jgi:hypothetical protein
VTAEITCKARERQGGRDQEIALRKPETELGNFKLRANVPINRPMRDLYCANRTSGPGVSGITVTVQITVAACIFLDAMNSNPNLAALTDRNF